jgi:hypothetical protein
MELTGLELDFLRKVAARGAWTSPPLFDRSLVARLVAGGYVLAESLSTGEVRYEITEAGRADIALRE